MRIVAVAVLAAGLAACSDPVTVATDGIDGTYALASVGGHELPAWAGMERGGTVYLDSAVLVLGGGLARETRYHRTVWISGEPEAATVERVGTYAADGGAVTLHLGDRTIAAHYDAGTLRYPVGVEPPAVVVAEHRYVRR